MGLHHRKLIPEYCELICHGTGSISFCEVNKDCATCFRKCLAEDHVYPFDNYPPPQQPQQILSSKNQHKLANYFILTLSLIILLFILVCIRSICIRSRRRRRRLREVMREQQQPSSSTNQQIDEEQQIQRDYSMVVDHPSWYIRTLGLRQSVIKAISVFKYKRGEGLIEGTECSVCLSEFEEDENLRVLPKCHHAFHLPCIDTWLSSHTNCPMCRAPIANNTTNPEVARVESLESVVVDDNDLNSSSLEHTQIDQVFVENSGDGETNFDSESRSRAVVEEEREGQFEVFENERRVSVVRPRRSVSMDDSFVANMNKALATVLSIESKGNGVSSSSRMVFNEDIISKVDNRDENLATISKDSTSSSFSFRSTRNLQGVPSPIRRSSSYNGKFLLSGIAAIRRSRRLF